MRSTSLAFSLGLPAALLLGVSAASGPQVAQDPAPGAGANAAAPIAVVDIDAILQSYPGALAKNEEWTAMRDEISAELRELEEQAKQKELAVEALENNTPERQMAALQYELFKFRAQEVAKLRARQLDEKRTAIKIELYDEIRRGVAAFAQQHGIDLVLRIREARAGAPRTTILDDIQDRDVLFHAPKLDVTKAVIAFLKGWVPK